MRSLRRLALAAAVVAALTQLAACAASRPIGPGSPASSGKSKQRMVAMVAGAGGLNDGSLNDSTYEGLKKARADLGMQIEVLKPKQIADYEADIAELAK